MIYISIDVETTGLNPDSCQLLSFGAIVEDTEKKLPFHQIPKFHCAILREERDILRGELYALNMNRDLIEKITSYSVAKSQGERKNLIHKYGMFFLKEEEITRSFFHFLIDSGAIAPKFDPLKMVEVIEGKTYPMISGIDKPFILNAAGKNIHSVDLPFIKKIPRWNQIFKIRHRHIDPSVLFADWKNDESLPNLNTCKERGKIGGEVTHDALEDAWDVVQLLRTQY